MHWLALTFLLLAVEAHAEPLQEYEHLISTEPLSLTEAMRSDAWVKVQSTANHGYAAGEHWQRYRLPRRKDDVVIHIDFPWITDLSVHTVRNGHVQRSYELGIRRPTSQRPITSTTPAFPVEPEIEEVYIRHGGPTGTMIPAGMLTPTEFSAFSSRRVMALGMFYGIALIMVLYNLGVYFGYRDSAYLATALFTTMVIGILINADAIGPVFLWPDHPEITGYVLFGCWAGATVFLLEITRRLLTSEEFLVNWGLRALQITSIAMALWVFNDSTVSSTIAPFSLAVLLAMTLISVRASLGGSDFARTFVVANSFFVLGTTTHIAMLLGWIPSWAIARHGVHLGFMAELIFLSLAMMVSVRRGQHYRSRSRSLSRQLVQRDRELSAITNQAAEQRRLQKSIQQAQKLKTIGQLAGGFAHDFNNILASVLGFAELARDPKATAKISSLKESQGLDEEHSRLMRYIGEIEKSGNRGAELVKQLLVYSRSSPSTPRILDITEALGLAQELLEASLPATIRIRTELPNQACKVYMDPEQLEQVLVNLAINGAEAMHHRGEILIKLEIRTPTPFDCTSCGGVIAGEHAVITVADSGLGIRGNPEDLFTPFQTSKDVGQGSGLGLSVVHGIVHEHNGHIHAYNRPHNGAAFDVYLPQTETIPEQAISGRVLLVERDQELARELTSILEEAKYRVDHAQQAVTAIEWFIARPNLYDIAITSDVAQPLQTRALDIAEDLRALRDGFPFIIITSDADLVDTSALTENDQIMTRPIEADRLTTKIQELMHA